MPHLKELSQCGYTYYFHYTIMGYPPSLEPHNPDFSASLRTFKDLSSQIGPDRVIWRYDPIVISTITPPEYHVRQFHHIASELAGYTRRCKFSFVNIYGKVERNLAKLLDVELHSLEGSRRYDMLGRLAEIARDADIELQTCCVDDHFHVPGIQPGSCIDLGLLQTLTANPGLRISKKPTRELCNCVASVDIGAYDTCLFGCAYCYATNSRQIALEHHTAHNTEDTILFRPNSLRGIDLDEIAVAGRQSYGGAVNYHAALS